MQLLIQTIREERKLIYIAMVIFLLSGMYGFVNGESISGQLKEAGVWDQLERAARTIKEDPTFWTGFRIIFFNNLLAAMTIIGLGIFFGVFPILSLITNGMMIGVVLLQASVKTGESPLLIFTTTILPHGILELPAIILAAAFGMRLGITLLRTLRILFNPDDREVMKQEWIRVSRRVPIGLLGIGVLLFFAAVIETVLILG